MLTFKKITQFELLISAICETKIRRNLKGITPFINLFLFHKPAQ
jgi:hypothetical protein